MTSSLISVTHLSRKLCAYPLKVELAYATSQNFVGRIIQGYSADLTNVALMTPKAAYQLCQVQNYLLPQGYGLFIYDAYRPKRACLDFLQWSQQPVSDRQELKRKAIHYPSITKSELFALGYVAENSTHCYGNTVDVFLWHIANNKMVDMGACFDFMDASSSALLTLNDPLITPTIYANRHRLATAMQAFGFEIYAPEFWHFSHQNCEMPEPSDIEISQKTLPDSFDFSN